MRPPASPIGGLAEASALGVTIAPDMVNLARSRTTSLQYFEVPGRRDPVHPQAWDYPIDVVQTSHGTVDAVQVGVNDSSHVAVIAVGESAEAAPARESREAWRARGNAMPAGTGGLRARARPMYQGDIGCLPPYYPDYPNPNGPAALDTQWYDTQDSSVVVADADEYGFYCYGTYGISTSSWAPNYSQGCAWTPTSPANYQAIVNNGSPQAEAYVGTDYSCINAYCEIDYNPNEMDMYLTYVGRQANTHIFSPHNNFNCTQRYAPSYQFSD